jgi:hypothetical protein
MAKHCYTQIGFRFQPKVVVDLVGSTLAVEAALLPMREFHDRFGVCSTPRMGSGWKIPLGPLAVLGLLT